MSLGNEGAFLPKGDKNPKYYWDVVDKTLKFLVDNKVVNPDEQKKILEATQSRITPKQELETISTQELIRRYEETAGKPVEFEGLHTGLKTLDDYLLGVQKKNFIVVCARTGVGKCERKGTRILMADGTTKKIEKIEVGEKVQGIDGPRVVLAKHNGFGKCYKITPKKGEPFYVSDSHIMTCMRYKEKYSHHKVVGWEHRLEDIVIEDLMTKKKHPDGTFTHYKLYRPAVEYDTKLLPLDPYILGIWLGDGTSDGGSLTTMDDQVRDAWLSLATPDHRVRIVEAGAAKTYFIATDKKDLTVRKIFEQLGVKNNKHIPLDYLTGDRNQRLQLLAGIIDTDGYLSANGTFEICQKRKVLADQIAQLARGLGFAVTRRIKTVDGKDYQRLYISGHINEIPVRVPKKQAPKRMITKDPLVTGFKIEQVEDAEYYGIQVDGDCRFLLWDNTITHNTLLLNYIVARFAEQGEKILYLALEENEQEVGDRWTKVVKNNGFKIPDDSVQFSYSEMVATIKEDKYNLIPLITLYAQLGYTVLCVDMLNNLIDTVRDEDGNVFLNRLVTAAQASGMTLLMTARLRQPQTDREKDFPTMDSVYGRVDLGYIVSKCIALTSLEDIGDGHTYLRLHILKNRRKQIGMKLTYPKLRVSNLLQIVDTGDDEYAEEQLQHYESGAKFGGRTSGGKPSGDVRDMDW